MRKNEVYNAKSLIDKWKCKIPIYQRLFVWDEEQINQLLEDLYKESSSDKPYYIGAITVVERKDDNDDEYWEIVDGQQRLTFLTLFGAMMLNRDKVSKWKDFLYVNDELPRIDYIGRLSDMKDIKLIIDNKFLEIKNQNIRLFTECFNKFIYNKENDKANKNELNIKNFSTYVYSNATFMRSLLSEEYSNRELNLYFERINATGRQLEPYELVKSLYFSKYAGEFNKLIDFSVRCDVENLKVECSNDDNKVTLLDILEQNIDDKPSICNEPAINMPASQKRAIFSIPTFLLHVLKLTTGNDTLSLNQQNLIAIFKSEWEKLNDEEKKLKAKEFIDIMIEYRTWLDNNIIFVTDDGYDFRDNANNEDESIDNNTLAKKKLLQYQSMLTVSSSAAQKWVLNAYKETKDGNLELDKLKKLDKRELNKDTMTYSTIDRYWFWKLDYILWEKFFDNKNNEVFGNFKLEDNEKFAIKNYKFRPNRSIEHLQPQNPQVEIEAWKSSDKKDSFGNLALISSSFNSTQSNDDVSTKFGRLTGRLNRGDNLESIKMLIMFKLASGADSGWTPDKANTHGEAMLKLLEEYHPVKQQ